MKSLNDLRNAFKTPDRENGETRLPSNYYPFWNIKDGEQATIRFLPDRNQDNPLAFLIEKVMHTLEINGERKSVPCLSMYGEDCPICAVSQQYYKADDKDNGKKYWKKKQHLAQALVVEDPMLADETTGETHVGKVRYIAIGFQLFNIIKSAFEDGELEEVPFAYKDGTNFIIKKTKQGDYPSYALSKFVRKSSDLDEDLVANLDLIDLSTLLPKHPGREKVEAMLEAAITGTEYNDGSSSSSSAPHTDAAKLTARTSKPVVEEEDDIPLDTPTTVTQASAGSSDDIDAESDDVLAQIRKRRQAKAS